MKKAAFITAMVSFIGVIFLIVIGETFDFTFMTKTLLTRVSTFLFTFSIASLLFFLFFATEKKLAKSFPLVCACFFSAISIMSFTSMIHVYQDREAYENKNFATIEGMPEEESFDTEENAPDYLTSFEIEGVSLDTIQLDVTKQNYQQTFQNQELVVQYLPNSKIVIEMNPSDNP